MVDPERVLNATVEADIQSDGYSVTHLFLLELLGGTVHASTDGMLPITYDGHTYYPDTTQFASISSAKNGMILSCAVGYDGPSHAVSALLLAETAGSEGHTLTIYECHLEADGKTVRGVPTELISGKTTGATRTIKGLTIQVTNDDGSLDFTIPRQVFSLTICQSIFNYHMISLTTTQDEGCECGYLGHAIAGINQAASAVISLLAFPTGSGVGVSAFAIADKVYLGGGILGMTEMEGLEAAVTSIQTNGNAMASYLISEITYGATTVFTTGTTPHLLALGNRFTVTGVGGTAGTQLNNRAYTVSEVVSTTQVRAAEDTTGKSDGGVHGTLGKWNITIDVDSSAFTTFTSGGYLAGSWCNNTIARCTKFGNLSRALVFPFAIMEGQNIPAGRGGSIAISRGSRSGGSKRFVSGNAGFGGGKDGAV